MDSMLNLAAKFALEILLQQNSVKEMAMLGLLYNKERHAIDLIHYISQGVKKHYI